MAKRKRSYAVKVRGNWVQNKAGEIKKFSTSEAAGFYGYGLCFDWSRVMVIKMESK